MTCDIIVVLKNWLFVFPKRKGGGKEKMGEKKVLDGVRFVDGVLHLWLQPALLGNVQEGVNLQLESFLLKYIRKLDGVVLAFSNVKVLDSGGKIYNDQPQVAVRVRARFLVFTAEPGQTMAGVVSNVGFDHVGVIVHGIFNASFPCADTSVYEVGKQVTFEIDEVKRMRETPGIKIKGIAVGEGGGEGVRKTFGEGGKKALVEEPKPKKIKFSDSEGEEEEEEEKGKGKEKKKEVVVKKEKIEEELVVVKVEEGVEGEKEKSKGKSKEKSKKRKRSE